MQNITGLSSKKAAELLRAEGANRFLTEDERTWFRIVFDIVREPMFLLLAVACIIYFILGDFYEGALMLVAMILVASISFFQEVRSSKAMEALRRYTAPMVKVIRDGIHTEIPAEEIVRGDVILVEEGELVPADAKLIQQNDLSVDESILTGESLPVFKTANGEEPLLFQGTTVASGKGFAEVTHTGMLTRLGQLGLSMSNIKPEATPLQKQINRFLRYMAVAGFIAFMLVFFVNYQDHHNWLAALLFSLTLAMSIIPEEIPVAFSSFMAIGAYRMTRFNIMPRQPQTVESLGSATVICLDKTGTITENKMQVAGIATPDLIWEPGHPLHPIEIGSEAEITTIFKDIPLPEVVRRVLEFSMWSSEPEPFDAMEKAIHEAYSESASSDLRPEFRMVHEYPLSGDPPMMTHVFQDKDHKTIIAGKGSIERILSCCSLDDIEKRKIWEQVDVFARKGYRVLGVASVAWQGGAYPPVQDDYDWNYEGLIALYDPPRANTRQVLNSFYDAGIAVKMITGDYSQTALTIARLSGLRSNEEILTGPEVMQMDAKALSESVKQVNIFARMFPEAKLRIVEALKAEGEVVAMTGDGVNDGPALKAAHIGVAMGSRGTEIARRAASLILLNDDLSNMVLAISLGRKIYSNLKKAIRYIISIHIPIVCTVMLPLLLGWKYHNLFTPIHVIFFELLMGPTCSIVFENEPMEENVMQQQPRRNGGDLFSFRELSLSIFQGLMITLGALFVYYQAMVSGHSELYVRSMVFITIISANIFLVLANRSFEFSIIKTIRYSNRLIPLILFITALSTFLIMYLPFLQRLFNVQFLDWKEWGACILTGFVSVFWLEVYKFARTAIS